MTMLAMGARAEPPPSLPFTTVDWVASMPKAPTKGVSLGDFRIQFEATTLGEVQRAVSVGAVAQRGDAAEHALWLCYTVGDSGMPGRIWLISDGEMGGDAHVITGITVTRTADERPSPDCPALPSIMHQIHFDVPIWLGSEDAQIDAALGKPSHVQGAWKAYNFQTKARDDGQCDGGYDMLNWLFTKSKSGKIISIYAGQVTSC
jgi:hypothetical protein